MRWLLASTALLILLVGCSLAKPAAQTSPTYITGACPLTPAVNEMPDGSLAGFNDWWFKGDGLWASTDKRFTWTAAPGGVKVGWWRAEPGRTLKVIGHRLNGPSAPLVAAIPSGYLRNFQASSLTFPTSGCWKVEAWAGTGALTFVVQIAPADQ